MDCVWTSPLTDANGVFIKSACMMSDILSYNDADASCIAHNMRLFVVNNQVTDDALFRATVTLPFGGLFPMSWMNGLKDLSGNWWSYTPAQVPMWTGFDGNSVGGDCLAANDRTTNLVYQASDCTTQANFICQY